MSYEGDRIVVGRAAKKRKKFFLKNTAFSWPLFARYNVGDKRKFFRKFPLQKPNNVLAVTAAKRSFNRLSDDPVNARTERTNAVMSPEA